MADRKVAGQQMEEEVMSTAGERCCTSHPDYMDIPSESTNCERGIVTYLPTYGYPTKELLALVAKWRTEQVDYPTHHEAGQAASAAVRLCANELEALL